MSASYISDKIRQRVAETALYRCGYCLTQEIVVGMPMEIEHIIPEAFGGSSKEDNLWLACSRCNRFKGDTTTGIDKESNETVPLFNPRTQQWREHFQWEHNGLSIVGITAIGKFTIEALQLNNLYIVRARKIWITAGWHPPT